MSLAEQLKRLAVPVTSNYSVEPVRRKSLVYEDPSKIDTLLCYQQSLKAFEQLAKRDDVFQPFRQTIFAETSCRLEMCNLLPNEKEQLDCQISKFLCFASPCLRHYDTVQAMEWLVYKFQIHLYYVQDFIRCVMPYHETGLFAKFLQLIDFKSCGQEFRWMEPYAEAGQSLSRPQLVRECVRQRPLVPFLTSMILNAVKLCKGLPSSRLNDITNFFLTTITAFCDSGLSDVKLANLVDSFQCVIRAGLCAVDCTSFQSATCLAVIRISLKLSLNRELVLQWIGSLLKHTRPGGAWESLRVVGRLMRNQRIAVLPGKLAEKHSALLADLSPTDRKLVEDEEANLLASVDLNEVAAEAMRQSAIVSSATLLVEVMEPEPHGPSTKSKIKSTFDDDDGLLADCQSHLKVLHALLASLPDPGGICLFKNEECTCPKLSSVQCDQNWLCDLLFLVLPTSPSNSETTRIRPTKREVLRARRLFQFTRCAMEAHLSACQAPPSPPHTRAASVTKSPQLHLSFTPSCLLTKSQRLLESGLDRAIPLLIACLLHSAPAIRSDAFSLLAFWLTELARLGWHSDSASTSHLSRLFAMLDSTTSSKPVKQLTNVFSKEVAELLRGDRLDALVKSAPFLTKLAVRLLLCEPVAYTTSTALVGRCEYACWVYGLQLLSEYTIGELFHIPYSHSDTLNGWLGFLHLIRTVDDNWLILHSISLSLLNAALFSALHSHSGDGPALRTSILKKSPVRPPVTRSQDIHAHQENAQTQLLDALCDLAMSDSSNLTEMNAVFTRLSLDLHHFDHILLRLDASRVRLDSTTGKSLFARVTEARETRRRHLKQLEASGAEPELTLSVQQTCDLSAPTGCSNANRLRLLGTVLTIITDAVARLHANAELMNTSTFDQDESAGRALTQLTTTMFVRSKSLQVTSLAPAANACNNGYEASILTLLTPLLNHLVSLLSQEQRFSSQCGDLSTDHLSDSDNEPERELGATENLSSASPLKLDMDIDKTSATDTDLAVFDSPCLRTLVRQCVHRLLVCMTALLAQANLCRKPRRRRYRLRGALSQTSQLHTSSGVMLAAQALVDPIFQCLSIYQDWTALHQQVLLCFVELATMFPIALCQRLVSLVHWVAGNRQLMRLDNAHSLALLGRLIVIAVPALVQASTNQIQAALQVVVVFVDALPGLTGRLPRRRLAFYTGLLRGLAQVTGPLALDNSPSSSPCGKSNSRKSDKQGRKLERQNQRALFERCRDGWIGSWLWTVSLVFLNRNWQDETVADQVVVLLIDLHNQFAWDMQVTAWYECLGFLLWISKNIESQLDQTSGSAVRPKRPLVPETPTRKLEVVDTEIAPPSKRRRMPSDADSPDRSVEACSAADVQLTKFTSPRVVQSLVSILFAGSESDQSVAAHSCIPPLNSASVWSLTGRAVQLLNTLLDDPTYDHKLQLASDDPLGFGAVYGRLVQQVVQLMISAAATLARMKLLSSSTNVNSSDASILLDGAKQTLNGLQKVLIQIHDSVSSHIFIRMISDLFASVHHGLRQKALELLASKLNSLTLNLRPIPILNDDSIIAHPSVPRNGKKKLRGRTPPLDLILQSGLVQLTAQLTSQYNLDAYRAQQQPPVTNAVSIAKPTDSKAFGSSFSRQSLACLRDLAKLLADRYPGEFMRTTDVFIASPTCWWPRQPIASDSTQPVDVRGSGSAESRSLACLFFVECLQRLPAQTLCPDASATTHRLSVLLNFALDHSMTSCRLALQPLLTLGTLRTNNGDSVQSSPNLVAGQMHSKDQHLLAGLTLLNNLMELAIVHRRAQTKTTSSSFTLGTMSSRGHWLQFNSEHTTPSVSTGSLRICDVLLRFVFQLGQLDLAVATGANPERCGSTLKQITDAINHLRRLLFHVTDMHSLLLAVQRVLLSAVETLDESVIRGALFFLSDLAETAHSDNSTSARVCDQLRYELTQLCVINPELMQQLFSSILRSLSYSTGCTGESFWPAVRRALASLLGVVSAETRLRLCQRTLDWACGTTAREKHSQPEDAVIKMTLQRLAVVYYVLADLSSRISAEDFSELSKQISLVDYLVLTFHITTGQKRKNLKKMGERLNLKTCVGKLANGATSEAVDAALAATECLTKWLLTETATTASLDVASGGHSVLELPAALVSLLDVTRIEDRTASVNPTPPILESQLMPTLDALVSSIAGDEALLRPLGTALATRIVHGTHWCVRLAAIRLMKRLFDRLTVTSVDQVEGGSSIPVTAQCLVSDALTALSEALEDDRPEVEAAANKLFAEMEQNGLSSRTESA
ncbi:hypothetical protein EG68_00185 [Paragonimus skrjabini miyazakii]|uniref:HEAT repeat-containing protein 1 n=1 Tax=Paragonimus skrjabini miyazakii TaxID=59628 RepID=A0A8S9Z4W1_9TREM|nr:hypothetical protein EG68_00185 [Paragonimus skrjabini miyazakii]